MSSRTGLSMHSSECCCSCKLSSSAVAAATLSSLLSTTLKENTLRLQWLFDSPREVLSSKGLL